MKKVFFVITIMLFAILAVNTYADQYDDVTNELEGLKKTFNDLNSANRTNEATLNDLNKQLQSIKGKILFFENEIEKKQAQVVEGEKVFEYQKSLLNARAKSYYKNASKNSFSFMQLLLSDNLSVSLQNFFYQKTLVDEDRRAIEKIALYIKDIQDKKKSLESETSRLAVIKVEVDKQSTSLAGEVAKTKKYLGELQSKIVDLSSRQQELLAQKIGSIPIPRSAQTSLGGCVPDVDLSGGNVKDSGFGGAKFAFFSFGVPNKIGMNQYGAWGRAKQGQNETQILQAYYNYDEIKKWDTNIEIRVDGVGNYKLEEYVKRLYEVPDSWTDNNLAVLKAQAIAARSYVLAYTNNGQGSICSTENCQVVKSEPKGGNWEQAVNQTEGLVMAQGGNPIKAWFSSTHGGVILNSGEIGWSSTNWTKHGGFDANGGVNNFSDLKNLSYDRDSKWFYCDWGYRKEYNSTAWLKPEEVTDIANAYLLYTLDKTAITHLGRTDSGDNSDTWDMNKVKEEIRNKKGTPFDSVNNIDVSWDSSGISRTINIEGRSFPAQSFKNLFNIRAPSNIQIKPACRISSTNEVETACAFALYNVEKR